jgi:hypothetical protein
MDYMFVDKIVLSLLVAEVLIVMKAEMADYY